MESPLSRIHTHAKPHEVICSGEGLLSTLAIAKNQEPQLIKTLEAEDQITLSEDYKVKSSGINQNPLDKIKESFN